MNPILLALAVAASPSTKLGLYVAGDDATSQTILAACPTVAVFPLRTASVPAAQIGSFRAACPGSRVIAQVGETGMTVYTNTASASWNSWLALLQQAGLSNIDAVEGPAEPNAADFSTLAVFWSSFADLVQANAFKLPIVGSVSTGTTTTAFCPTANAMKQRGTAWAWSFHAFSNSLTQSVTDEVGSTFGYRTLQSGCTLTGVPVYVTQLGPSQGRGWLTGDAAWLAWVDEQLASDAEIVGAALYEAGGTDRSLSPIATQLAAYLQNPTPSDGGTPDGGSDAGQSGGVAGGGGVVPSGPPGDYPKSGCATTGAGVALVALLPVLALTRRRASRLPRPR